MHVSHVLAKLACRTRTQATTKAHELGLLERSAAAGVACDGCPPLPTLAAQFAEAGGRLLVYPICFSARKLEARSIAFEDGRRRALDRDVS